MCKNFANLQKQNSYEYGNFLNITVKCLIPFCDEVDQKQKLSFHVLRGKTSSIISQHWIYHKFNIDTKIENETNTV